VLKLRPTMSNNPVTARPPAKRVDSLNANIVANISVYVKINSLPADRLGIGERPNAEAGDVVARNRRPEIGNEESLVLA
jgi:hypothetical protein